MFLFIFLSVTIVIACGILLPMGIGFKISMITAGIIMAIIFSIVMPFERKYVVRKNGYEIDFAKTKVYFRWNVFDTVSVCLAIYACICVQVLNILVSSGFTIQNPYVQFFTNQAQVWTLVSIIYLISRISLTLKGIKEIKKHGTDWD